VDQLYAPRRTRLGNFGRAADRNVAGWYAMNGHRRTTGNGAFVPPSRLDVPVRFDTDHMAVTIESFHLHRWQQIPIVELRS
jgi:hypothetical protein